MAKKEPSSKILSTEDILAQYQKSFGAEVGSVGGTLLNNERIPTGCFPLDLALGGGIPRGKCTIIFGPESSGKTNIALLTIAQHQRLWPDLKCVFIDLENSFDPGWAAALGVDLTKIIVVKPAYGEQMVDMVEGFMYAADIGIVVVDSLAAVISTMEVENSAEKKSYGGNSILIGLMCRKTTLAMLEAEKQGRFPTLIYINQTRNKLGVMFGNPEDMPGGNAPKFQANMWFRTYGKPVMDTKISQTMPVRKNMSIIVRKWKVPIVSASCKFDMITVPHDDFKAGEIDDWNTISEYLKQFDQFNKHPKKGWIILEEEYPTMTAFKDRLRTDKPFAAEVKAALIQRVMTEGAVIEPVENEEWGEVK